jgi:F-type H+-transporting ATPase subunit gamma
LNALRPAELGIRELWKSMEELERAQERLENIRSVKPILSGLRTISLGSWQGALKRQTGVQDYAGRLRAMLPSLLPQLQARRTILAQLRARLFAYTLQPANRGPRADRPTQPVRFEALVIGSERGLCGRFNVAVAEEAERYLKEHVAQGVDVHLRTLGSRAQRVLQRRGYETPQAGALSVTALPPFSLAFELASAWLAAYERQELDAVDLIHNGYRGTGAYKPTVTRLIPPRIVRDEAPRRAPKGIEPPTARQPRGPWPPPIVETDPLSLYATVIEQWAAVQLHQVLLDSAAAEHSTRFQLMESATQNADRLIEELTLTIQTARRQQITQEMGELAAGAGLIGRE